MSTVGTEPQAATVMEPPQREEDVTSTHVLVPPQQLERLRALSQKTRVAQSEYLREAVNDLLRKYGRPPRH